MQAILTKTLARFETVKVDLKYDLSVELLFTAQEITNICNAAAQQFEKEEMLVDIELGEGDKLYICGDIHGQLIDLLEIFGTLGYPSDKKYLFLGDYVDRGHFSTETICLLFLLKCVYPQNITLLRGNHENFATNYTYGFKEELKLKYRYEKFMKLHITFNGAFNIMPASALINHKVLCMHGGIGPTLRDLRQIRLIPRPTNIGDYGVLCDLLWADPAQERQEEMFRKNKGRGISVIFNQKALETFLNENNLLMIIRAHEVEHDGYKFHFDKKCITVFSATNYGGRHGNKGAVIEMTRTDSELKCRFKIFE